MIYFVSKDMLLHLHGPHWRFYDDLHLPEYADVDGNVLYRVVQPWFPLIVALETVHPSDQTVTSELVM